MISPISSVGLLCLSTYLGALVGSTAIPSKIFGRQDGTCGGSAGLKCATDSDKCCSQWGWCGDTPQHCGTGCQPNFGSCTGGGGTTTTPPQSSTTPTPSATSTPGGRSRPGNVPYGSIIESCTASGVVALTFDDGPDIYTQQLIDLLGKYGAKATFFVNGHNWGVDITDPSKQAILKSMDAGGHQIGSHTWSHASLSSLSAAQIRTEMTTLESAIQSAIGKYPTYMRPPYFDCGGSCAPVMDELCYHIIDANLDTLDWANTQNIQQSKDIFSQNVASNSCVLAHDVHQATVSSLAEFMITETLKRGLRLVTVGECLGDPAANWYRT